MSTRSEWVGGSFIRGGVEWLRMVNLTICMLGLQLVWSVEMAYASPYLIQLGLSKAMTALVFLAGPLSGLLVQPIVGIYSDRCTSTLGRRKPFIIGSIGISSLSLLVLSFAPDISAVVTTRGNEAHTSLTIAIASIAMYAVDFSINALQATDRALLVDSLPATLQDTGNAWAARMHGIGSVLGFFIGAQDLPKIVPFFGNTQIKCISVLTVIILVATHFVTCFTVVERILIKHSKPHHPYSEYRLLALVYEFAMPAWHTFKTLPKPIWAVCQVQGFSQFGWFPIMFYASSWIGEIYKRSVPSTSLDDKIVNEDAQRAGSRAFLFHAIFSLITSILVPIFVSHRLTTNGSLSPSSSLPTSSSDANDEWTGINFKAWIKSPWHRRKYLKSVFSAKPWLTLPLVWTYSHILFAFLMLITFIGRYNLAFASIIIAFTGICQALILWVPFALLGQMIMNERQKNAIRANGRSSSMASTSNSHIINDDASNDDEERQGLVSSPRSSTSTMHSAKQDDGNEESNRDIGDLRNSITYTKNNSNNLFQQGARPGDDAAFLEDHEDEGIDHSVKVLQIRHSDSIELDELVRSNSVHTNNSNTYDASHEALHVDQDEDDMSTASTNPDTANHTGIILGIHNIFIVIPQFLVSFVASIVFALFSRGQSVLPTTPANESGNDDDQILSNPTESLLARAPSETLADSSTGSNWDAIGMVMRIGGISAAIAAFVCWKKLVKVTNNR